MRIFIGFAVIGLAFNGVRLRQVGREAFSVLLHHEGLGLGW